MNVITYPSDNIKQITLAKVTQVFYLDTRIMQEHLQINFSHGSQWPL